MNDKDNVIFYPIKKDLISLYSWTITETEQQFVLKCQVPIILNTSAISFYINSENNIVRFSIPGDNMPFFAGRLNMPVSSFSKSFLEEEDGKQILSVVFIKAVPKLWDIFIVGYGERVGDIDPFSAYQLSLNLLVDNPNSNDEQIILATQLLQLSAGSYFPPALAQMAQMLIANQKYDTALQFLDIGTSLYDDVKCHFTLGLFLYQIQQHLEKAISELNRAGEQGEEKAYIILGEIYSPLYPPHNKFEDANLAFSYFQKVQKNQSSVLFSHLSEHYLVGSGCEKDLIKANEFKEKAIKLDPTVRIRDSSQILSDIKSLEKSKNNEYSVLFVLGCTGVAALVSAAALFMYRHFKHDD